MRTYSVSIIKISLQGKLVDIWRQDNLDHVGILWRVPPTVITRQEQIPVLHISIRLSFDVVTPGVKVSKLLPEMGVHNSVCQLRKVKGKYDKAVIITQCRRKLWEIKPYILCYLLSQLLPLVCITNLWSTVVEKLIVALLFEKLPTFHKTRSLITASTVSCHWT